MDSQNSPLIPNIGASREQIEVLIERYSLGITSTPARLENDHETRLRGPLVVLLTGSTGNLGSHILAELLEDDVVSHVYAFNRPSQGGTPTEERHLKIFTERGLDTRLLNSTKLSYVLGDASEPNLGIDSKQYTLLSGLINVVIHNAWRISFVSPLSDFEPHIRATRHLVDLLKSGPYAARGRFLFASSVFLAQAWPPSKGLYPEEIVTDPSFAVGRGYGASKYVAERILASSGLQTTSFRIGQITGSAPRGAWDTTEWAPIFYKSCVMIGCVPDFKGVPHVLSFIPANSVAAAIVEATVSDKVLPSSLNLVNPQTTKCELAIQYMVGATEKLLGRHLDVVPMKQWLSIMEKLSVKASADMLRDVPAIFLLSFFRGISDSIDGSLLHKTMTEGPLPIFSTEMMCQISPCAMKELKPMRQEDLEMWIRYWREVNFVGENKAHL